MLDTLPQTEKSVKSFILARPLHYRNYRRFNMINLQKMLQDAEWELRDWGQAYAGNADPLALNKLQVLCDKIALVRRICEAKFTW